MKLGNLLNLEQYSEPARELPALARLDPQDTPNSIQAQLEPTLEQPEKQQHSEFEFPDSYVPDELNLNLLKSTNESLAVNGDLAAQKIDLLQDSIDIVREMDEITPIAGASIRAQLRSIESTFPETEQEDVAYLDKVLTSDSPVKVEGTLEAMINSMASLRPIVNKSLGIARNISQFLQTKVNTEDLLQQLAMAKRVTERTERPVKEGYLEKPFEVSAIFPKIIDGIKNGYKPEEIHDIVQPEYEGIKLSQTAIIAISKGISRIPLTNTRDIDGPDLGQLFEFIQTTQKVQDATVGLLSSLVAVNTETNEAMAATAQDINAKVKEFFAFVLTLATKSEEPTRSLSFSDDRTVSNLTVYQVYPDGPMVALEPNGKVLVPYIDNDKCYGFFDPKQLSDLVDAMETKVFPAFAGMTKKARSVSELSSKLEEILGKSMSDKIRMTDIAGSQYQVAFLNLLNALKFVNSLVTVSTEATLNISSAIIDVARGVGILSET